MRALVLFCCLTPLNLQAHYIPSSDTPLTVNASLVATYHSENQIDEYAYWQIPGTMMGGDAWPVEEGLQLDEVKLGLAVRADEQIYAIFEAGTHASGSDDHQGVSLEHAYLGYVCCQQDGPWVMEAGRMSALFSPDLSQHASERLTSEASLMSDVFFGRNFHDEGIRFMWHTETWIAGAEGWKGKAFPATASGTNAWDVFARYSVKTGNIRVSAGLWWYQSSAESRIDHRYGGGHQHTPVGPPGTTISPFPDTRFTGDTDIYGLHAELVYPGEQNIWKAGIKTELMDMQAAGQLQDDLGRVADVEARQMGLSIQPYVSWREHTFGLRAEWLSTDNQVTGAAANQLSGDAGLGNPEGFEPAKYTAIWKWQFRRNLALRTELIQDESLPDEQFRFAFGVIWQQTLWPFNGAGHSH